MYIHTGQDLINAVKESNLKYFFVGYGFWKGRVVSIENDTITITVEPDEFDNVDERDLRTFKLNSIVDWQISFEEVEMEEVNPQQIRFNWLRHLCDKCPYFKCPKKCDLKQFVEDAFKISPDEMDMDKKYEMFYR